MSNFNKPTGGLDLDSIISARLASDTGPVVVTGGMLKKKMDIKKAKAESYSAPVKTNNKFISAAEDDEITNNASKSSKSSKLKTPIEEDKVLKNYIDIPRSQWNSIEPGMYIRYKTQDGQLKTGARVRSMHQKPDGSHMIELAKRSTRSSSGYFNWSVNTKNISNIYLYNELDDNSTSPAASTIPPTTVSSSTASPSLSIMPSSSFSSSTSISRPSAPLPPILYSNSATEALEQIGDKLLSDDNINLSTQLEAQNLRIQSLEEKLKRMFILMREINNKINAVAAQLTR